MEIWHGLSYLKVFPSIEYFIFHPVKRCYYKWYLANQNLKENMTEN